MSLPCESTQYMQRSRWPIICCSDLNTTPIACVCRAAFHSRPMSEVPLRWRWSAADWRVSRYACTRPGSAGRMTRRIAQGSSLVANNCSSSCFSRSAAVSLPPARCLAINFA